MQYEVTKLALRRAIREKCLDCCYGQEGEVRRCAIKKCSLWPYRIIHKRYINPNGSDKIDEVTENKEMVEE